MSNFFIRESVPEWPGARRSHSWCLQSFKEVGGARWEFCPAELYRFLKVLKPTCREGGIEITKTP